MSVDDPGRTPRQPPDDGPDADASARADDAPMPDAAALDVTVPDVTVPDVTAPGPDVRLLEDRPLPDDGPVIDPRDPLGLGDLTWDDDEDAPAPSAAADAPPPEPGADVVTEPVAAGPVAVGPPPDGPLGGGDEDADEKDAHDEHTATQEAGASPDDAELPVVAAFPDPFADVPATGESPTVAHARASRASWRRIGRAIRPRTTKGQLITAGLCALLGFALVVQVRQTTDTQLGALRENDLVRLLDETTTRTDELERESADLQRERDELLSGSDRQQAALDAARRTAAMQGILTGRLPATGPGVRVTLTEPDGELRPATMVHVLEELRNAGAEAIELNGQRITASSAFTGNRGAVELDGVVLASPFRWSVIGDPDTIAPALEIPGGALARVRADGGRGTVEKSDRVDVTAVRLLNEPVHASPAAAD